MTELFGIPIPAFLSQLLLGLVNGSFYAILSLGLAVIFGLQLVQWEQSRGVRLFALPGQGRELFVRPAA